MIEIFLAGAASESGEVRSMWTKRVFRGQLLRISHIACGSDDDMAS